MSAIMPASYGTIVSHVHNGYNYHEFIGHYSAKGQFLKNLEVRGSFCLAGMLAPELILVVQQGHKYCCIT